MFAQTFARRNGLGGRGGDDVGNELVDLSRHCVHEEVYRSKARSEVLREVFNLPLFWGLYF